MNASPKGQIVGRKWQIGEELGSGSCGIVHELLSMDGTSEYVIKLSPLPSPTMSKRKQKELKKHADLLHFEKMMYQNQLCALQGTMIPRVPLGRGPPTFGEIEGYQYLVIERMAAPFSQVVSNIRSGSMTLRSVANRLVDIVEAIHKHHLLVLDIKPDNFMLNHDGEIVILDFGLFQSFANISGHRPNDGAKLAGTPLYVSLNLHDGETPSRRDDIEAILYMLIELVLNLQQKDLPWSSGRSEEDVGTKKKTAIEDEHFWNSLGSCKGALRTTFEYVTNMEYAQKPDYITVKKMLSKLPLVGRKSQKTTPKKAPLAKKPAKKRQPARKPSRRATKKQEVVYIDEDEEEGNNDDFYSVQEEEDDFHTCHDVHEDMSMDFEVLSDDGCDRTNTRKKKPSKAMSAGIGVTLKIVEGPHKGETISLVKGENESIEFGAKSKSGFSLAKDPKVDSIDISMELQATRRLTTVLVKNMSSSDAFVKTEKLSKGKSKKIFINDTVRVGNTEIKVSPLAVTRVEEEASDINYSDVEMEFVDAAEENVAQNDERKAGVTFVFSDGEGESFELYKGDNEYVVLGSKPKDTNSIVVPGADAEHVKLTLQVHKKIKYPWVVVKDLSSSGAFIDAQQIKKEAKLFVGQVLKLGATSLKLKRTPFGEVSNKPEGEEPKKRSSSQNGKKPRGFLLEITEGPHIGETIKLLNTEGNDTLVLGANPRPRNGFGFRLNREKAVTAASHLRIELDISKKSYCKASVTDLKARGKNAQINGDTLETGKSRAVFANDMITIGQSVIKIKPLG